MSKHFRSFAGWAWAGVVKAVNLAVGSARFCGEALRYRDDRVSIEVLVTIGSRRRKIERELRAGLRQLQHILGPPPLSDIAVVVQQIIVLDRQLAGCYQLSRHPDGSQSALLRVALEVNHTRLSDDDLLAVVAEQWIAVTNLQSGPSILVPVDCEFRQAGSERRAASHQLDPLVPYLECVHPHRA